MERIHKDPSHWDSVHPKRTKMWRTCILPEVLGRWYTRKHDIAAPPAWSICYCRRPPDEMIVRCENLKCPFIEFHSSCLEISRPPFKTMVLPKLTAAPSGQETENGPQQNLTEPG